MASTKDAATTVEDIQRDVQALRDDMARLAAQVTELLSAGGGEAIGKIKKRVGRMQELVRSVREVRNRYNIEPRTPLDVSLGLMKNILINDLRNLSGNKEVSDTVRKMATRMFRQKLEVSDRD